MNIKEINKEAEKFKTSIEQTAFLEGVRRGFSLAIEQFIQERIKFDQLGTKTTIVIKEANEIINIE